MRKTTYILIIIFLLSFNAKADDWFIDAPKYATVVLKPSHKFFSNQKFNVWNGRTSFSANIGQIENSYTVNGDVNWKDAGWSLMHEFTLSKTSKDKKAKSTVVELRSGQISLKLFFNDSIKDLNAAFKEIVHLGGLSDYKKSTYFQKEIEPRFLPNIFKDKLADIPIEIQRNLINAVQYEDRFIGGEEFKGNFYLMLGGTDTVEYNTNQVNQPERVAKTIEKFIALGIKDASDLSKIDSIKGVKLEMTVFYRDFVREAVPSSENVSAYFLVKDLADFKNADITNQQLIDKSFVMVNGNRVQVSLTQFK